MADKRHGAATLALALVMGGTLTACGGKGQQQQQAPQGPPTVGYVVVREQPVTLTTELPGRTTAFETSEVRPQVNGLIRARLFTEGDMVRAGQPLYRIDSAPYQAQVASARAALARARAAIASSEALARRYGELVKINAIARQEYENAQTSAQQARADVAAQQAALRTAQIDLARTTIRAPISGRIGRSLFTVGALVSASQTDPLAQIQRLDPIFVDIQQSAADLLSLRRKLMQGGVAPTRAEVKLLLEDGSDYGYTGTVEFAEALVNQETGTVTMRARFPNAQGLLLPGMFVRARFAQAINERAFLVPEPALSRDAKGNASVMILGANNKVVSRRVTAARTQGQYWVVTQGLNPGDKVITQGLNNLRPGAQVKAVPANSAQVIAPPKQGEGKGDGKQQGNAQSKAG